MVTARDNSCHLTTELMQMGLSSVHVLFPSYRMAGKRLWRWQVLGASLEAHVAASDNSALAKDCRRDIKAANAALLKLSRKVPFVAYFPTRL